MEAYVKDLWRGNVGLAFTYWVIGALGNFLFSASDIYLDVIGFYDIETEGKRIFFAVFLTVSVSYSLFTVVCIWRSATKYKIANKNNMRAIWGTLAKVAVVLGVLRVLAELFGTV